MLGNLLKFQMHMKHSNDGGVFQFDLPSKTINFIVEL